MVHSTIIDQKQAATPKFDNLLRMYKQIRLSKRFFSVLYCLQHQYKIPTFLSGLDKYIHIYKYYINKCTLIIPSWQCFNVVMGVECVHLAVSFTGTAYGILLKEN